MSNMNKKRLPARLQINTHFLYFEQKLSINVKIHERKVPISRDVHQNSAEMLAYLSLFF